jgi:hypothetical protein
VRREIVDMLAKRRAVVAAIRPIRDIQAELQWQEESVVRRILDEFGPTMIKGRRDADPRTVLVIEIGERREIMQAAE